MLLPVAIINSNRLVRLKCFIPFFTKIVIKVGQPINPPEGASKNDLGKVTHLLQDTINKMLE